MEPTHVLLPIEYISAILPQFIPKGTKVSINEDYLLPLITNYLFNHIQDGILPIGKGLTKKILESLNIK